MMGTLLLVTLVIFAPFGAFYRYDTIPSLDLSVLAVQFLFPLAAILSEYYRLLLCAGQLFFVERGRIFFISGPFHIFCL